MALKRKSLILSFGLALLMLLVLANLALAANLTEPKVKLDDAVNATAKQLMDIVKDPTVSPVGGEWTIIGLARSGYTVPDAYYDKYYANVVKTLKDSKGVLSSTKYTEYSRVILALTAIGKDVTNVGGYNLLKKLADYDNVKKQGINGPVFALMALDSHNYAMPQISGVTRTSRQMLIDFILSKEIKVNGKLTGGFSLDGKNANPDVMAMVVQALFKYRYEKKVQDVLDRDLALLSTLQKSDGGFTSSAVENPESISQVMLALNIAGIDPKTDSRFIKGSNWIYPALINFYLKEGGFKHLAEDTELDLMASEQAFYALSSYKRFVNAEKSLYDMNDVKIKTAGSK